MSETSLETTSCVLDCPDTCSLEVSVEDGRITRIDSGPSNPVTEGFICSKVRGFHRRIYHDSRLLHPMRRVGRASHRGDGQFERIGWDEAIETIRERFSAIVDEHGAQAILPYHYGGSNGFLTETFLDDLFFSRLGASRLDKTICAAPTTAVAEDMYGSMPGVAFPDYVHAKFILIWGANPKASNIHLVPYLQRAKREGAFVAMIDPMRTMGPDLVDLHIPVFPGADLPLALGMIRHFKERGQLDVGFLSSRAEGLDSLLRAAEAWPIERAAEAARVSPDVIRTLADKYSASEPALLRCGWGVERNRNGGQAVAAILAMPALLGKFGVRGGGYTLSNSGAGKVDWTRLGPVKWKGRTINMTELSSLLTDEAQPDPIRGLFVYNCNPVVTVPDQNRLIQGLSDPRLFTVVFDQVMTDTARYAEIILPATTFFEHYDYKGAYGSYVVGGVRPVIKPVAEARSNVRVFLDLGRAMGFDGLFELEESEIRRRLVDSIRLNGKPVKRADVLDKGETLSYDFDGDSPVQLVNVQPGGKDGKIQLTPECLGAAPYEYRPVTHPEYPLALISPSSSKLINSTLGEVSLNQLAVRLHPLDASARSLVDGDSVSVVNELGEVHCIARVDEHVRPGVAMMPKGAWMRSSDNGRTSTALTPATTNIVAGGACFNDARVEVRRRQPSG